MAIPPTDTSQSALFCQHDPALDALLRPLHARLRAGGRPLQLEIDRYLVAVTHPALRDMVLARNCVPHYDNLPDLSHYALGIIDPSKDASPEYQQVHLLLRQCTPLRRRTKRAQRELQWHSQSMRGMQVLVRCMFGTLLGLYPTCCRPVAFAVRVKVFQLLRSMLVAEFPKLHACMQRIRYIIKLCVMEHLCNTVRDYHPALRHMLDKGGQQVVHFSNAVTTMCDTFRTELNQAQAQHDGCLLRALPQLERSAHSFFERCTRAYRGIITVHSAITSSAAYLRRTPLAPDAAVVEALNNVYPCASQFIFDIVHRGRMSPELVEATWHVTQSIRVHMLPDCVRALQLAALRRRHEHDSICVARSRQIHLCVFCSARRQAPCAGLKRYDCASGQLICKQCNLPSILAVDMLGRLAVIGDAVVLLSSCCGALIPYKGTGMELGTVCGPHCTVGTLSGRARARAESGLARRPPVMCRVCSQRNVSQQFHVLQVPLRQMLRVGLCVRHSLHPDILATVADECDLDKALALNQRPTPLGRLSSCRMSE